jgi:tetratricopeptide (TPR) repeat protein
MFDIRRLFAANRSGRRPASDLDRGLAALAAGRPDEALVHLAAVLEIEPSTDVRALALNKRGVALVALGRRPEARAAFDESLEADRRYAPALVNIGNLLLEDGAVEEAIESYRAALRADQDYAGAHLNLGVALKRVGRTAEGVEHLRMAHRLEGRQRS